MRKLGFLAFMLAACSVSHAQGLCARTAVVNVTAAGINQVLAPPPDGSTTYHVCGIKIQVTQGATPANYNIQTCTALACTGNVFQITPVMQGHASTTDNYNVEGSGLIQINIQRGQGLYLNLSAAPTSATVQIFFAQY